MCGEWRGQEATNTKDLQVSKHPQANLQLKQRKPCVKAARALKQQEFLLYRQGATHCKVCSSTMVVHSSTMVESKEHVQQTVLILIRLLVNLMSTKLVFI